MTSITKVMNISLTSLPALMNVYVTVNQGSSNPLMNPHDFPNLNENGCTDRIKMAVDMK